jgi:hypothetical protein
MNFLVAFWTVFGLVYVLSIGLMAWLSVRSMRAWHTAYWREQPLTRLAAWHPHIALQGFDEHSVPERCVEHHDRVAFLVLSLLPLVNTTASLVIRWKTTSLPEVQGSS